MFQQALAKAGIAFLNADLHSLRHGGVSHEVGLQLRPLVDAGKRGRWKGFSTLKRYEKHGRIQAELNKLSKAQLDFAETVSNRLHELLRHPEKTPKFPW